MYILQSIKKEKLSPKRYDEIIILKILFILPFLFCVFRPINSTDTGRYYEYFLNSSLDNITIEKSYLWICIISKLIGGDVYGFRIVLFIYTLLATLLFFKVLEKSKNITLSFLFYFSFAYLYQMNIQMRSCVANLLFLYAIYDIKDKNWKMYYFKILLAFFFHSSSVFFLIIYPYCRLLLKKRKLLKYIPFVYIIGSYYLSSIISFIISLANSTGIYALQVLQTYTLYYKQKVNPLNRISLFIFLVYFFYVIAFQLKKLKDMEIIALSVLSLSIFCYFIGAFQVAVIGQRYPEALNLVFVILLPFLEKRIKEKYIFHILVFVYLTIVNMQYGTFRTLLGYYL